MFSTWFTSLYITIFRILLAPLTGTVQKDISNFVSAFLALNLNLQWNSINFCIDLNIVLRFDSTYSFYFYLFLTFNNTFLYWEDTDLLNSGRVLSLQTKL